MHGIVDGIGGSVKRFVRERILAQDLIIKSAEDFVNVAKEMNVEIRLMKSFDIKARNILIGYKKIVKDSKKIPDIKKKHFFQIESKKTPKVVGTKITPDES